MGTGELGLNGPAPVGVDGFVPVGFDCTRESGASPLWWGSLGEEDRFDLDDFESLDFGEVV